MSDLTVSGIEPRSPAPIAMRSATDLIGRSACDLLKKCLSIVLQNFTLEWCKQSDRGLPEPDHVFFLNLRVSDAEERGGFGEERYEKKDFQEKVRKNFLQLKCKRWTVSRIFYYFESNTYLFTTQVSTDWISQFESSLYLRHYAEMCNE